MARWVGGRLDLGMSGQAVRGRAADLAAADHALCCMTNSGREQSALHSRRHRIVAKATAHEIVCCGPGLNGAVVLRAAVTHAHAAVPGH